MLMLRNTYAILVVTDVLGGRGMKALTIELERAVYQPGERDKGRVLLELEKSTTINKIEVEVKGLEYSHFTVVIGRYPAPCSEKNNFLKERFNVVEKGELPAGFQAYPFSFWLPENALPTYEGSGIHIKYTIKARVDIPWAIDIREKRDLQVNLDPQPKLAVSDSPTFQGGTETKPPWFEAQLERNRYLVNETINGRLIVHNPTTKRIRKATINLFTLEDRRAKGYSDTKRKKQLTHEIEGENIMDGLPIEFQIQIPDTVPGTYSGLLTGVKWVMQVRLDIAMGIDVTEEQPIYIYR